MPRLSGLRMTGAKRVTTEAWGPSSPLMDLWECERELHARLMHRTLAVYFYGDCPPYRAPTPQSVLRRRAIYGGKKGRAAIRRLRAMGARPISAADI